MGIKLENTEFADQSAENNFIQNEVIDFQIQSGTYKYGGVELRWKVYLVEDIIEITFYKSIGGVLQSNILNRENPKAKYVERTDFPTLTMDVRASFDEKQLKLDGKICGRSYHHHGAIRCNEWKDVLVTSW